MTVSLWISGQLEPERVEGDLLKLLDNLNIAAATGKQYALLEGEDGEVFMVQTKLITKAKEADDDTTSYIGVR